MPSKQFDLLVIGELSVDSYIQVPFIVGSDEKAIGEWLGVYGGGMGANFAAAAAGAGVAVSLATVLNSDQHAARITSEFDEYGIDLSGCVIDEDGSPILCFIQLDSSGEKALIGASPGRTLPEVSEISDELLESAAYVYLAAIDLDWTEAMIARVRATGGKVVLDIERSTVELSKPRVEEIIRSAEIVFTNTKAFPEFGDSRGVLNELRSWGVPQVIVTDGRAGAVGETVQEGASAEGHVVSVADSTGAGDAHNGAVLGALIQGRTLREALTAGAAAAAACLQRIGSRTYLKLLNTEITEKLEDETKCKSV